MRNYCYGTQESANYLIDAGMPKHPRLRYRQSVATLTVAQLKSVRTGKDIEFLQCHPQDARDLLTMHALRWLLNRSDGAEAIRRYMEVVVFDESTPGQDSALNASVHHNDSTIPKVTGPCDVLDAIVEAIRQEIGDGSDGPVASGGQEG